MSNAPPNCWRKPRHTAHTKHCRSGRLLPGCRMNAAQRQPAIFRRGAWRW
uniref:Uncharacterized protein n=1 Tax=Myoviridae sp. ctD8022 TaxID=2825056 RepID=A0A8S5P6N3_9CAUD|nr:MAG TPA: hypothetical protein [Myoviridae sp. ctD8022]DAO90845.1 MAG TPA: hypothetical protein [Caudoviricetes sp.]